MFGDTVAFEEGTFFDNNDFDTQVMDGYDSETQPMDFEDETKTMELAGETQVLDDDGDFLIHLKTQNLDTENNEDCECNSDKEDAEGTEVVDDTTDDICGNEATSSARRGTFFRQDDGGPRLESPSSHYAARSSGSLRRGFASVRTASLRAAGLSARQSALKNADYRSSFTIFSNVASEPHVLDDDGGMYNVEADGVVNDEEKINEHGLNDEDNSSVVRSLAKKLFLEEDVAEMGSDDNVNETRENFFQLPSFDNDAPGLSYVDSQEPGELSQANALDFVDRFLKASMFESDLGLKQKNSKAELLSPTAIAKGAYCIARQASTKSTPTGGSIYEWDDSLEDDGGGEFFTKKKDELFGTINKTRKLCPKPQSSGHHGLRGSHSAGKLEKEKGNKILHDTMNGSFHSDLKLKNVREKVQVKEIGIEKNVDNCAAQQLGLASCYQEVLPAVHNSPSVNIQNVGIDTQIAAEAIEALAAGDLPVNNDCNMSDQNFQGERDCSRIQDMKNGSTKRISNMKRVQISTSRVVTRSRSKRTDETPGQSFMRKFDVGLLNSRAKRSRLSVNDFSPADSRRPSDTTPESVALKQTKIIWEGHVNNNPLPPLKRRCLRKTTSVATPVAQEADECIEHHPLGADSTSSNSGKWHCLEVVSERKRRTRNDAANSNYRNETLDQMTAADVDMVDGANGERGDTEHASSQCNHSRDKGLASTTYGGPIFNIDSIARRTRSRKNTIQSAECSRVDKGLRSSGMLSPEDACRLSYEKEDEFPPSAHGTLSSVTIVGTPGNAKTFANPADTTPVNLKTPRGAVSPICVGNGYYSPSCKKNLSLKKEFMSLIASEDRSCSPFKGLRQRRDVKNVRILFSQHLDDDIIRQQKKILSRLGVSVASSISEATHFVADMFVRTRNMLEAIANAKPVVTHLWLESCGQANCFIDEKSYILRDAKKEKELGFSMPKTLAHASQHPLLEGIKILITPNVKPGKKVILSLVKAVHGQAVERLQRSTANDELFVLSCEEDFGVCLPILEKGIEIYSSELLLNGIITQRLEYERYRLFGAHVKKTRSRLWLNKNRGKCRPVTKSN